MLSQPVTILHNKAIEEAARMAPAWHESAKCRKTPIRDGRTPMECAYDSGVFAASELVRRITGDENLAASILEMCHWAARERSK